MYNPLDKFNLTQVNGNSPVTYNPFQAFQSAYQQAMQNPAFFEQQYKSKYPQAYQMAMQIRNSANPQQYVLQMARDRGFTPDMLRMLGIK